MNRSASRTPFHESGSLSISQNVPTFPLIDRKVLPQILSKQGIDVSPTFFETPKREEICKFLEDLISLVFGPQVVPHDIKSVQRLLDVSYSRNKRNPLHPIHQHGSLSHSPTLDEYLPDRGERQLQGISIRQTFRYMKHFGELFGLPDIRIQDVARPTTERLIVFGSAIVAWIRFQESALVEELQQWENVAIRADQANDKRRERDEFREAARCTYQKVSQTVQERNMLEVEVEEKQRQLFALHQEFKNALTRNNDVELKHSEIEEKLNYRDAKANDLKSNIKDAEEQIVDSPRSIVETLKTITAKCEAEQNAIKVEEVIQPMDQQYRSIMNELNKRSIEAKNMIEKRIEIVRENEKKIKENEEQKKRNGFEDKELSELTLKEKSLRKSLELTQDELTMARKAIHELREQCDKKKVIKQMERDNERKEKECREREIEKDIREGEELDRRNRELNSRMKEEKEKEEILIEKIKIKNNEEEELIKKRLIKIAGRSERQLCDEGNPLFPLVVMILNDSVAKRLVESSSLLDGMTGKDINMLLQKRNITSSSIELVNNNASQGIEEFPLISTGSSTDTKTFTGPSIDSVQQQLLTLALSPNPMK